MADNQRQDKSIDLATNAHPSIVKAAESASIPPQPISPFQALVEPEELLSKKPVEQEAGPIFPTVEKRTSFTPKPSSSPVLMVPIKQLRSSQSPTPSLSSNNSKGSDLNAQSNTSLPSKSSDLDASTIMPQEDIVQISNNEKDAILNAPTVIPQDGFVPNLVQEEHHDDHILDLSDEMLLDSKVPVPSSQSDEPISIIEMNSIAVGTSVSPIFAVDSTPPTVEEEIVFDERETVIDNVSLKGRSPYEEANSAGTESSENKGRLFFENESIFENKNLFVKKSVAEEEVSSFEISVNISDDADPSNETSENDANEDIETEELDLADAEEMTQTRPPAVPTAMNDGRKPIIRRRRKQNKEWWARIFNDDYVSTIPKATVRGDQRKVNFIEKSLGLGINSLVLDLACGNGRHSVGMAKRGYRVVGIDLSLPMLAQAAELAQDERQNINFIHGDMRDLSFDKTFDAVFCMGTSFGYFDDDTNARVLQGVYRALKPGGSFLLEVANRDHVVGQTPELTWFEGNGSICMEETSFNYRTSRLVVTRQLIMDGGRQVQNDISIRVYSLHEIEQMFLRTGFEIGNVSGHTATPGAFFGPDSVRIFICAKRSR